MVTGPYCAKLMADLGAQVIKIEKPGLGDAARRQGPFPDDVPHRERSGLFLYTNTNKLGVTLDPGTPRGRKIFLELAARADIVLEDRAPGEMARMGLDYDTLKAAHPRVIMVSITPFGQWGPYRDYKAYCLNLSHGSGAGFLTPMEASEDALGPIKSGGFFDHFCNGLSIASAALVALFNRVMTGEGQHIDASEQEASLAYDRVEVGMFAADRFVHRRVRVGGGAPMLPCRDGYVLIAAGNPHHWKKLVEFMGRPPWTQEERFKDDVLRFKHSQELNAHLAEWTKGFAKEDLYHNLSSKGIPAGVVRTQEGLVERDGQLKARAFFTEKEHPEAGTLVYPSCPYRLSETSWRLDRPAPMLGQHNDEVYTHMLGYGRQELVELTQWGII